MQHISQFINQVTCGDCVRILPELPTGSIDFVLTDPPYLVRYRDRQGRTIANDDRSDWLKPHLLRYTEFSSPTASA